MTIVKRTIYFLMISAVAILSSCGNKVEKIPKDILPQKKMIALLADIQIAEAAIQLRNAMPSDSAGKFTLSEYKYVFEKNHITNANFKKSFDYYTAHPDLMADIYKEVIITLSKQQAEAVKPK